MPGFMKIASGPYCATYDGNDVGEVEGVYRMQISASGRDVTSSKHGDAVVDSIYRGLNVFMIVQFKEWTAATKSIIWPWDATLGESGEHGRLFSELAKPLVLTASPGTPAATEGPVTVTIPLALYAPAHTAEITFGIEERIVPIVFRAYPCKSSGAPAASSKLTYFTTT